MLATPLTVTFETLPYEVRASQSMETGPCLIRLELANQMEPCGAFDISRVMHANIPELMLPPPNRLCVGELNTLRRIDQHSPEMSYAF